MITIELEDPPFEAALIAGDFICCLRSSLDYLAWQLAVITTPIPSKRVCFPIYGENTPDNQVSIAKSTFGIPEPAISLIKSFQPYHTKDYAVTLCGFFINCGTSTNTATSRSIRATSICTFHRGLRNPSASTSAMNMGRWHFVLPKSRTCAFILLQRWKFSLGTRARKA